MASAIHSRYLLSTDLEDQAKDAANQLAAFEAATDLGLYTEHGIEGECLDVYFAGEAETVTTLVETLYERQVYINWVTPESEEENELFGRRLLGLTEIERVYDHR
jgi:hypothetical protein